MGNMKLSSLMNAHFGVGEWELNLKKLQDDFFKAYDYLVINGAHPYVIDIMIALDVEIQRIVNIHITSRHRYGV